MNRQDNKEEVLCISIPAAERLLGVSRATAYQMARLKQLPVIKCGQRRWVVSKPALMRMLEDAGSGGCSHKNNGDASGGS